MTAKTVNGIEVVLDEPALSDICNRITGEPLVFHQTRHLLLADGTETYGCLHCDFTSPNKLAIRPHLHRHNKSKKKEQQMSVTTNGSAGMDLADVLRRLEAVKAITDRGHDVEEILGAVERLQERGISFPDVLRRLESLQRVQEEREAWKQRAQRAERDVKRIRAALGL